MLAEDIFELFSLVMYNYFDALREFIFWGIFLDSCMDIFFFFQSSSTLVSLNLKKFV